MTNQQKEGIIIIVFCAMFLFTCYIFSDWQGSFWHAEVGTHLFSYKTAIFKVDPTDFNPLSTGRYYSGYSENYPFVFDLKNIVFITVPVLLYGLLRAANIVRRLFAFEVHLSKLLPNVDQ